MGLPDFDRHSRQRLDIAGNIGTTAILRRFVSAGAGSEVYGAEGIGYYESIPVTGLFTPLSTREIQAAGGRYQEGDVFVSLDSNAYVLQSLDQIIVSGITYRVAGTDQPMPIAGGGADRVLLKAGETFALPNLYHRKVLSIPGSVAYWPLWDSSGTVAREILSSYDGVYTNTPTLGAAGIGDGNNAVSFDGTNEFVNIYSAGLNGAFNGQEFTIGLWAKAAASTLWTDSAFHITCGIGVNGSNQILLYKVSANNTFRFYYAAGGTVKSVDLIASPTTYQFYAITVSKSANQVKAYINGVQTGATQTGLGTWAGSLNSALCGIAVANTSTATQTWYGSIAHTLIYNRALSATEIASLASLT